MDRPVSEAWVELKPENNLHKLALMLNPVTQMQPLNALALGMLGEAVAGRTPCRIDEGGKLLSTQFTGWLPGSYRVHFQDSDGLGGDFERDLRIFSDPPPTVSLRKPGTSQSLLADAVVHLHMLVDDEIFAIHGVFLEYQRKGADGVWLEPRRLPIVDPDFMSLDVPRLLAAFARSPMVGPPLRLRPKQLELFSRWPLRRQFHEGETVVFRIGADDFNNLFTPKAVGYSHDVEIRIVGKSELDRQINDDFAKVQQEIVRLQAMQDQAEKIVKEVLEERKKDPTGALDKSQNDKVIEAEQIQKQIQERIERQEG